MLYPRRGLKAYKKQINWAVPLKYNFGHCGLFFFFSLPLYVGGSINTFLSIQYITLWHSQVEVRTWEDSYLITVSSFCLKRNRDCLPYGSRWDYYHTVCGAKHMPETKSVTGASRGLWGPWGCHPERQSELWLEEWALEADCPGLKLLGHFLTGWPWVSQEPFWPQPLLLQNCVPPSQTVAVRTKWWMLIMSHSSWDTAVTWMCSVNKPLHLLPCVFATSFDTSLRNGGRVGYVPAAWTWPGSRLETWDPRPPLRPPESESAGWVVPHPTVQQHSSPECLCVKILFRRVVLLK